MSPDTVLNKGTSVSPSASCVMQTVQNNGIRDACSTVDITDCLMGHGTSTEGLPGAAKLCGLGWDGWMDGHL